jgi:hypothetical protein
MNSPVAIPATRSSLDKRDLVACALIAMSYAIMVLLMPIARNFAYVDDWTFAHTVEAIAVGQGFRPSELGQMTLATHAHWGALFDLLLGVSFTSLTAANMVMSLVAALTFYVLLRRVGLEPGWSGLGVAMLVFNPFFLGLSYSFMTEITFVAMMLLTCLCYFEGLRGMSMGTGYGWLWLGSVFAALTFLTRQFGLALPLAAILWLLYARKLSWSRLASVALVPAVVTIGYFAWSSGFGPTLSGSQGQEELLGLLYSPNAWAQRLKSIHFAAPLLGLTVPLFARVRRWWLVLPLAAASAVVVYIQGNRRVDFVQNNQAVAAPFDVAQPFRLEFSPLWAVGAVLTVWLVVRLAEQGGPGLIAVLRRRRRLEPIDFLYLTGIILLVGTFLARMEFFVRYMLPVLPFVIIAGLAQFRILPARKLATGVTVLAVLAVAISGIALHLDDYDFLAARWQAGHDLVAQGVPYEKINNGFTWDAYYLYDEALKRYAIHDLASLGNTTLPEKIIDPEYVIGVDQLPGYHVVKNYPYFSRLDGMAIHQIYVMQRN